MRPLGTVFNFSPKGSIVVKATITPRIGNFVCDNKGRPIGKIVRITGPVKAPYVLVSPMAKDEMSMFRLSGKKVFIDETHQQRPPRPRRPPSTRQEPKRGSQRPKDQRYQERKDHRSRGKAPAGRRRKGPN